MLTYEELEARREIIAASPDLSRLLARLHARAEAVVKRQPVIPRDKALLTADGGFCPDDGTPLAFDPWNATEHRCPRCGTAWRGERHDRRWAHYQHLWLAERIAHLAAVGILSEDDELLRWAVDAVRQYALRYTDYPNADNVLGPSRLFFSTYLESVWLTQYLAGAFLLREAGALDEETLEAVNALAEEAANLIGDFDEGLSNRQTWHNAALTAVAVWFADEDLARRSIEGPRGLVGHLVDGFRPDGMWYEGENYHLFALRGLLTGAAWARLSGVDFYAEEASLDRIILALRAPALTALPDATFPARKDSRFAVSLAQPMYLELWEAGIAGLLEAGELKHADDLAAWLRRLYDVPAPAAQVFDSYLHEAGEPAPGRRERAGLSWWMLLAMAPELPAAGRGWTPGSVLLEDQGLAVLRQGDTWASLECGPWLGGHGHPDRLHLGLVAGGVPWLVDPGTGAYTTRDLFWYRSTLAHNAPRLDGASQSGADAGVEAFEGREGWSWVRARWNDCTRTVIAGPRLAADVLEFAADAPRLVELPWHLHGSVEILSPGRFEPATLPDEFATDVERFLPAAPGPVRVRASAAGRTLELVFDGGGELLRASVPGRPGATTRATMLLRRETGRYVRFATALSLAGEPLSDCRFGPAEIAIGGAAAFRQTSEGWEVEQAGARTPLRGLRRADLVPRLPLRFVTDVEGRVGVHAVIPHLALAPAVDGSLAGFPEEPAFVLDHEDQYRRSEAPYAGPNAFSARARLGWDEHALFVAVDVTKPERCFRPAAAPPARLDNEPDDIHSDGLQLFLQLPGGLLWGWLVVPDTDGRGVRVSPADGSGADAAAVTGAWVPTDEGYRVTLALRPPGWPPPALGGDPAFDLMVNEMQPGRLRRAGQLTWSGGGGWVYLRGDRPSPERFGRLTLA